MWALVESGTVSRVYNGMPSKITVSNRNYDQKQLNSMTATERKAVGIVPVTTSGSHLDARFYTEKNEAFALAGDKNSVVRTIGVKAADKKLDDTNNVDEIRTDHKAICDAIDGASDMDAFIALHNDTYDSDGKVDVVARVNRWTDDYEIKKYRR